MLVIMLQIIYKTKIVGDTPERPGNEGDANRPSVPTLNVEVTIPLKYLSNFWKSLFGNRSEITTQPKHNNLDYLIDITFRNI